MDLGAHHARKYVQHLELRMRFAQELTGQQSQNLGAGTISSRSRPITGVILLDEVQTSGPDSAPTVRAQCCPT